MRRTFFLGLSPILLGSLVSVCACSPTVSDIGCGAGTTQVGHECIANDVLDGGDSGAETPTPGGPPIFAGVTSAAPAAGGGLQLTWAAATDAVSASSKIVYRAYVASSSNGENFSAAKATSGPGATFMTVTGLDIGKTYFVVVRAVNEAGVEDSNSVEKSAAIVADTKAPEFAGVDAAVPATPGAVKLTWQAAKDDLTPAAGIRYIVYVGIEAGKEAYLAPALVTDPGATSVVLTGLTPNTMYFFVVRARDAAGNVETNKVELPSLSGKETAAPAFGGCTDATQTGASTVRVQWKPVTDDVTPPSAIAYDVWYATAPGKEDFASPPITFTGGSSGVVSGLKAGTLYYFVCRARNLSGLDDTNTVEQSATTIKDNTPPIFGGVTGVKNIGSDTVDLTWVAAKDDYTPDTELVYEVFQGTAPGGEDAAKVVGSATGTTTVTVKGLASGTTYYWWVRARDLANNEDANKAEVTATTFISFKNDIQPIFTTNCAVTGCHIPGSPPANLVLAKGFAYSYLVGVPSQEVATYNRIQPTDFDNSYLFQKISGKAAVGSLMPPPSTGTVLTTETKDKIKAWIVQGALNN